MSEQKKTLHTLGGSVEGLTQRKEFAMFNRPMLIRLSKHKKKARASEFSVLMGIIFGLFCLLFVAAVMRGDAKTALFTGSFAFFSWHGLRWELLNNGR